MEEGSHHFKVASLSAGNYSALSEELLITVARVEIADEKDSIAKYINKAQEAAKYARTKAEKTGYEEERKAWEA